MAAILVLAVLGISSTAQASGRCPTVFWGSLPKASSVIGQDTHLVGARAGQHSCFDRLVLDLDGAATGYRVEYVSEVQQPGSGDVVPLRGGALIRIIASAPGHDDNGQLTIDPADVNGLVHSGYQTFRQVAWAGSFEGQTTIGLGVRARLPFRVFALNGPGAGSRLVIDVAHSWSATGGQVSDDLPGEAFEGHAAAGDVLGVMGVAADDVLNIRARPGTDHRIIARAAPTEDGLVATGRGRLLTRSIWYEVTIDGVTGWAHAGFLAFIGDTNDVTSAYLADHPRPSADTMAELGAQVAADFASDDPPSRIVQVVAPTVGDLGEVTYDVVGLGDDSVAGIRLHLFAVPGEYGQGFELTSIEATDLCARGSAGSVCV
ncbi:MAG: SH3 domain-containing protein [Actinomycetota bacterium]